MNDLPELLTPSDHPRFAEHLRVFCEENTPRSTRDLSLAPIGITSPVSRYAIEAHWLQNICESLTKDALRYRNSVDAPRVFSLMYSLSENVIFSLEFHPENQGAHTRRVVDYPGPRFQFVSENQIDEGFIIHGEEWAVVDDDLAPAYLCATKSVPQVCVEEAAKILTLDEEHSMPRLLARLGPSRVCAICHDDFVSDTEMQSGLHIACAKPLGIEIDDSFAALVEFYRNAA
ncbi:hypothetical protein R0137_11095 [Congregibacter brevis]|uniref:Mannose-6-phosphate isomerase n=1 Tax=Congregibacter brevis TaxID=3081201 RepID=A0ABZ0I8D7_9GAMM|nr:hypothetical protein R0137_11095 [Congregibacter sp. IMCC45268]